MQKNIFYAEVEDTRITIEDNNYLIKVLNIPKNEIFRRIKETKTSYRTV